MKKFIFCIASLVSIMVFNIIFSTANINLSLLSLENIEALADESENDPYSQKVREKISYEKEQEVEIQDIIFRCYTVGRSCEGDGSISCTSYQITDCNRES